jgi:hypothetical protein
VIVLGQYGRWKEPTPTGDEEEAEEGSVIDVTVPLQYKVEDSQLILEEGSKAAIYGICVSSLVDSLMKCNCRYRMTC